MAYDSNRMGSTRRGAFLALVASAVARTVVGQQQDQQPEDPRQLPLPNPPNRDEDQKLPNGKSQKDEIAKQEHRQALKDAENLLSDAQELRDELKKAGDFVVPVGLLKRTEDIEKLARRIRGRLKS